MILVIAQAEGDEIKKRNKSVDLISGPQNYHNIVDALKVKDEKYVYATFYMRKNLNHYHKNSHEVSRLVTIQEGF